MRDFDNYLYALSPNFHMSLLQKPVRKDTQDSEYNSPSTMLRSVTDVQLTILPLHACH